MDIYDMLSYNGQDTMFHGVRGATLSGLLQETDDGAIHPYGRSHRDYDEEESGTLSHIRDNGYLYVTRYSEIEFSANEFCDEEGLILVLGARVNNPEITPEASRERVVRLEEWEVIGGVRPAFNNETGELDEENWEVFSLEEVLSGR